jgi:hypothetical protein
MSFGAGSVIGVARKLGVHRRMVREAVRNAFPAQSKKTERPAVKMAEAEVLVDANLALDRKAPWKQRHTAGGSTTKFAPRFGDARQRSGRFGSMWSGENPGRQCA